MIFLDPRWEVRKLGDLVDVLDSKRVPVSAKERASRPGSVPYYGAAGPVGSIDQALFDEPLILLGEDGVQFLDPTKAKAYLIDGPAWVNNHAHVLRARSVVDREFLNHYLNAADYAGVVNGTTRLKLTQAAMRGLPVPVPPVDEQRRIVAILEDHLSRLDAARNYLEAAGARLIALNRSSLEANFGLGNDGVALDDLLIDLSAGKSFGAANAPAAEGEWGIIKVSAMTWGRFRPEENKAVTADKVDPRFEIRAGDLLVSRANTSEYVGASVLVHDVRPKLLLSDKSLRLTPRSDVHPAWLWRALQAPSARRQISALATGTKDSMRNISQGALLSVRLPVAIPSQQEAALRAYQAVLDQTDAANASLEAAHIRLVTLRRALLSAAFSGQLTGHASDLDRIEELVGV